jgi:hypothetical protein
MPSHLSIAEVEIDILPGEGGGPTRTIQLRGFSPYFRAKSGQIYGVQFLEDSGETVESGEGCTAIAQLMYGPGMSFDDLPEGATFEILEGTKFLGRGRVVRYIG